MVTSRNLVLDANIVISSALGQRARTTPTTSAPVSLPGLPTQSQSICAANSEYPANRSRAPRVDPPGDVGVHNGVQFAYNARYLRQLHCYIEAKVRDERHISQHSWSYRLPAWIKAAKNRDQILKAIANWRPSPLPDLTGRLLWV